MAAPLMRRVLWSLAADVRALRAHRPTRSFGDDAPHASLPLGDRGRARRQPNNAWAAGDARATREAAEQQQQRRRQQQQPEVRRSAAVRRPAAATTDVDDAAAVHRATLARRVQPPSLPPRLHSRAAAPPLHASLAASAERPEAARSSATVGAEVIEYEYLEDSSEKIGAAFIAAKSRLERKKNKKQSDALILLEGHRLVKEAFAAGVKLKQLFFSGSAAEVLQGFRPEWLRDQAIYKVRYQCLKTWSDVQSPQGVCGFFEMPPNGSKAFASFDTSASSLPVTVICDKITEPGNMGAIIRSAAAAGCERLIATKGCVSIWEPKVIRAAAGGHFHIQLFYDQTWDEVNAIVNADYTVYLASSVSSSSRQHDARLHSRRAKSLLLKGADECDVVLDKRAAAADGSSSSAASAAAAPDDDESGRDVDEYRHAPLVTTNYCDVGYTAGAGGGRRVALVVGGETHGLSGHAHKLAFDRYGCRVHVPMAPHVDSLNSAVAVGVVLFEIRRQLEAASSR